VDGVRLIQGDCLDVLREMPDASVDAILTDPPYPRRFMHLYEGMAEQAKRVLKRGVSLVAIVPHYCLPDVLAGVGQHLKYRWACCMWQARGTHPRMAMGVEVLWKPIVWWVNGAWPKGRGFIRDGFDNDPPAKEFHEWEQAMSWAEYCLRFVRPGDTVVDPMMGGGTMGVACVRKGIHFIGCEIDAGHFATAQARIAAARAELLIPA
jgi:hypothetical protein